ncbi:IS1595 family transposase [Dyadobacter chenhuakuii]|uniref:IS1595 family transposase n=1 Tax=Dyadobacter chenhuakuii TaxID=2909339 RepID=A0A9X1TWF0_9BACT|nr:IS1595 family transposase [Dyadobacter chenhuakuii]MCF2501037.1 IS1595 family transposase [Dyadobacter chenhuakuii]
MIGEFKSILDLLKAFPDETAYIKHLENLRWAGAPVSPFDSTSQVYLCANNRYKCKKTGKYFNVKVGTIFEDTKIPLQKWFLALYIFSSHKKGISSHQLAKDIDVTQKSAWFMLHRLRYAFDHPNFQAALGEQREAEIDETYMGGKESNKHQSKKIGGTQGRSTKGKQPVLEMNERGGNVIVQVVGDTTMATVQPIVKSVVIEGSEVITDEWKAYKGLSSSYDHSVVRHGSKECVNGKAHTNTIEGFWSLFKRGIDGIYHWVSVKHLQVYVGEFALRYNSRKFSAKDRFNFVLDNMEGRLTYKALIK